MVTPIGGIPQPNPVPKELTVSNPQKEKWLVEINSIIKFFEEGQNGQAITHLNSLIVEIEGYRPPSQFLNDAVNKLDSALTSIENGQPNNVVWLLDEAAVNISNA